MDAASLCFATMMATGKPRSYTDAEIKEEIAKQQAFDRRVVRGAAVPPALIEHLRKSGVALAAKRLDTDRVQWVVEPPATPPACTVVTDFLVFPKDTEYCEMIRYIMRFNLGSVRNEPAMMSMFYPYGRGEGCMRDQNAYKAVQANLIEAFQSYVP